MRFRYLKRYAGLVVVILCGIIILLSLVKNGQEEWEVSMRKHPRHRNLLKDDQPLEILEYENANIDFSGIAGQYYDSNLIERLASYASELNMNELITKECEFNETLKDFWKQTQGKIVSEKDSWEKFYARIGSCDLYRDVEVIDRLLNDLHTLQVNNVAIMGGGTQVKLVITFENDEQAVFKPMRFGRDYETDPNHFYFSDFERHNAEIATFHLDRVIGFRRAVPTVGRVFNMTSELMEKAEKVLQKTFFISPAKNLCFVSKCDYYCDTNHAICGKPDLKEGSVQVFLPDDRGVPRKNNKSPYRRTYSKRHQMANWQKDNDYCTKTVKRQKDYAHGRKLLDLIDLHILDFLIDNLDRHHYETFTVFDGKPVYPIHLDNGRAFGRTDIDHDDILYPLQQCCLIRPSTLRTLMNFYRGPQSLSQALHKSMSADPVKPILATKHYSALERRLYKIMLAIDECVKQQKNGIKDVVMAEYHSDEILENAMDFLANDGENEETKGEKNTDFNNLETNLKLQR